ncbi:MAG: hypothetical protein NC453_17300 [Muribaculum sp.]|nr:hypothetical protein [Muribaculum sp.]
MTINLDTTIDDLRIQGVFSVRAYSVCRNAHIENIQQLMQFDKSSLLKVRNCGRKTLSEILDFKEKLDNLFPNNTNIGEEVDEIIEDSPADIARKKISFLHPTQMLLLDNWIKWRFEKLSVSAKNCVPTFVNLEVVLPIAFSDVEFNYNNINKCGKKSSVEISSYVADVKSHISELIAEVKLDVPSQQISEDELVRSQIELKYPFLLDREVGEVASFYIQHNHLPMLFIAQKYIVRSDDVKAQIHREYYGLNGEENTLSLEEIGFKHTLSRERVRQITRTRIVLDDQLNEFATSELPNLLGRIVANDDPIWTSIAQDNMWEYGSNVLLRLVCSITGEYTTLQLDAECKEFLVQRSLLNNVRPKAVVHELCRLLDLRRTVLEEIDIISIIKEDKKRQYNPNVTELSIVFIDYIKRQYDYSILKNRYILALPNALDVSKAIENILEQKGTGMSLNELWVEFNALHPSSNIKAIETFKLYVLRNSHIKSKGKSGIYVLEKWKNHFTGSITDYLAKILETLNEPVELDDLVDFAQEQFPNTTKKSIYTLINIDKNKRFVILEDDYVGLACFKNNIKNLKEKKQVRRYNFDSRFESLKTFVQNHKRMPIQSYNQSEDEQSLSRWLVNALNGSIGVSNSQDNELRMFLSKNKDIPQNGLEYRFKQMCDTIKVYVTKYFALPDIEDNPSEYNWLRKNLDCYEEYMDNRKTYFIDLLLFLKDYGFYL